MQRRWQVLTLVSVATFVASLDLFIVNIAFPDIRADFGGASVGELSWVLNAYAIVFAALLVPAGRLSDRAGRRRGFLGGLTLFVLGSALCGLAPSVALLVAARVLQAAGAALLVPTSLALLLPEFEPRDRPAAIGIWAGVGAAAAAAGPPLGGLLVQVDWRLVFFVNLPVGAWALWRGSRLLTETRDPDPQGRPDWLGAALFAAAIGALTLGFVQAPEWGWSDVRTLGALAAAAAGIALFAVRCARHPSPIVDPAMLRVRSFSMANVAAILFSAAFGAMLLSNVLFQTTVWNESILRAGLQLAPGPALAAITAVVSSRFTNRVGQRTLIAAGCTLFATGMGLVLLLRRHDARLGERAAPGPDPHRHRRRAHAAEPQQRRRGVAAARALRDRGGGPDDVAPARHRARRGDPGRAARDPGARRRAGGVPGRLDVPDRRRAARRARGPRRRRRRARRQPASGRAARNRCRYADGLIPSRARKWRR